MREAKRANASFESMQSARADWAEFPEQGFQPASGKEETPAPTGILVSRVCRFSDDTHNPDRIAQETSETLSGCSGHGPTGDVELSGRAAIFVTLDPSTGADTTLSRSEKRHSIRVVFTLVWTYTCCWSAVHQGVAAPRGELNLPTLITTDTLSRAMSEAGDHR
jgi:hypothetical protein